MTVSVMGALKAIGVVIAMACLLAGGWMVFRPVLQERERLEHMRDEYRRDNEIMTAEIAELRRKQTLFRSDPDFVEQVARRENRVRPNEIIFVFPKAE